MCALFIPKKWCILSYCPNFIDKISSWSSIMEGRGRGYLWSMIHTTIECLRVSQYWCFCTCINNEFLLTGMNYISWWQERVLQGVRRSPGHPILYYCYFCSTNLEVSRWSRPRGRRDLLMSILCWESWKASEVASGAAQLKAVSPQIRKGAFYVKSRGNPMFNWIPLKRGVRSVETVVFWKGLGKMG